MDRIAKYDLIRGPRDTPVTLGFGSFGTVKLAKNKQTGELVALKLIYNRNALNEVQVQRKLSHPNIVKISDASYDKERNSTLIAMEYVDNGTLFQAAKQGRLTRQLTKRIFYQICKALAYCHQLGFMHRDIKPENILLTKNYMVKLCDFGFAAETEQARKTICGTYEYMSPEMVVGEPYSQKNDVWSLGVLLYELIEGTSPFRGENREQIFASMRQGVRFSKKFTEEEISLISSILKFNPYHRPEVVQILKHVYFQGQCELANFTNLLTEPTSPSSSRQIKLLQVKLVKSKPDPESRLMAAKSLGEKRDHLEKFKIYSNESSTASNSICEKGKISLKKI